MDGKELYGLWLDEFMPTFKDNIYWEDLPSADRDKWNRLADKLAQGGWRG